jgi:hypothetical protein
MDGRNVGLDPDDQAIASAAFFSTSA